MKFLYTIVTLFILKSFIPVFGQTAPIGEDNAYKLTYLGIPAVNIYLSVPDTLTIDGKRTFHVLAVARTNALFSPFYTLENRYHTYIDAESGLPVKFTKDIHQSTLDQHGEITYDQDHRVAVYEGGRFSSQVKKSIQENTHNLFSMIYFLRRGKLEEGQRFTLNLDVESEPWKVTVTVMARETVSIAGISREAHKVSFQFTPVKEEIKRKHTDILTRRVATSATRLYFWIGAAEPFHFLKVEYDMSPFSAYTTLVSK